MPRKPLMSWEGHPQYRFTKMFKGVKYYVTCRQLGLTELHQWTKANAYPLANTWWLAKRAEIDGNNPALVTGKLLNAVLDQNSVDDLQKLIEKGEAARRTLKSFEIAAFEDTGGRSLEIGAEVIRKNEKLDSNLAPNIVNDAKILLPDNKQRIRTLNYHIEKWLELKATNCSPLYYSECLIASKEWQNCRFNDRQIMSGDMDIVVITHGLISEFYSWLVKMNVAQMQKKKRWQKFKNFVHFCYCEGAIELPRNLSFGEYKFKVESREVPTFSPEYVRETVNGLPDRLRLYALLGLNCGFTQSDMGGLKHKVIDWKNGIITHKRGKTKAFEAVPTVKYQLWEATFSLLKKFRSNHPDLVLVTENGAKMYLQEIVDGKLKFKDQFGVQWKRNNVPISLKMFRKIGATMLQNHPVFGRYVQFYLGHSPKSVAEIHYAPPSDILFFEALKWLEKEIFFPDTK